MANPLKSVKAGQTFMLLGHIKGVHGDVVTTGSTLTWCLTGSRHWSQSGSFMGCRPHLLTDPNSNGDIKLSYISIKVELWKINTSSKHLLLWLSPTASRYFAHW